MKAARRSTPLIDSERLYKWQKEGFTPVAAAHGVGLDPATAAESRQMRTLARRQAQELEIKKSHYHLLADT